MPIQLLSSNKQKTNIDFKQFSGGERHIQLDPNDLKTLAPNVNIRAELLQSHDILDYLLLEDILIQHQKNIRLEIPYFPYARQDRVCTDGQAFSLQVFCRLLDNQEIATHQKELILWDVHSDVTLHLLQQLKSFHQITHIPATKIMQHDAELSALLTAPHSILVCPDQGAITRSQDIAAHFNPLRQQAIEVIYCDKVRDPSSGKITSSCLHAKDLRGKTAIICDDICDGGATFIGIAKQLRALHCQHIVLYVTHGIFSRGLEVFDGLIEQVFCSNSRPQVQHPHLNIIDFEAL
ncbi:phosphoribosyltransferase family protein [Acinetobacter larvae]|uniref:Ribose-phosphate pyrophosphokinase n=1 Tax=Acinetobacter larvae TaxID=1789224 RepID=A0A1B2M004_9GAMM|nr:phosphoribosyltransferase family protein [Acinetobacter larvae]AOA58515.1 ribose-phosphate pyrophosphokinase [Acinetobacter larvae]